MMTIFRVETNSTDRGSTLKRGDGREESQLIENGNRMNNDQ